MFARFPPLPVHAQIGAEIDHGQQLYFADFSANDRLSLVLRHELSRFLVPNEQLQEAAGQLENRDNLETMRSVSYQHTFSPNVVGEIRGMVRDDSDGLWSHALATPLSPGHGWVTPHAGPIPGPRGITPSKE
jgi:hypothetical protein